MWRQTGEHAIEQLEQEIANLRAIITDPRPPALDEIGLVAALHGLCERQQATSGARVRCELSPADMSLGSELETTVYRVAQEALTNVVKHAHATNVQVDVDASDDRVSVQISDDGVGFDNEQTTSGWGLGGLRERVELAHGTLAIRSSSEGTTLHATLPTADTPALANAG